MPSVLDQPDLRDRHAKVAWVDARGVNHNIIEDGELGSAKTSITKLEQEPTLLTLEAYLHTAGMSSDSNPVDDSGSDVEETDFGCTEAEPDKDEDHHMEPFPVLAYPCDVQFVSIKNTFIHVEVPSEATQRSKSVPASSKLGHATCT